VIFFQLKRCRHPQNNATPNFFSDSKSFTLGLSKGKSNNYNNTAVIVEISNFGGSLGSFCGSSGIILSLSALMDWGPLSLVVFPNYGLWRGRGAFIGLQTLNVSAFISDHLYIYTWVLLDFP